MRRREMSLSAGTLIFLLAVWEASVTFLAIPEFILPSPSDVVQSLGALTGTLMRNASVTLLSIGIGFALGSASGLFLAVLMSMFPAFRSAIYPLVLATQTTPKIALAPLFIVWFGIGLTPRVLIVALLAFFPVLVNGVAGLANVDPLQLDLMRSVNAGTWQVYRHLRLPGSVPYVFAGFRLALTVSIIGAVVSEWIASSSGLGYLLVFYIATLRTANMFAVLLTLLVIAVVMFGLIMALERALSWEVKVKGSAGSGANVIAEAAM